MKAQVLYGINDLRYEEVPLPQLKDGEVLVKVEACGICGSDVGRVFKSGTYHYPTIIGHEFSGKVYSIGETKRTDLLGKRVGVFPLKPCFKCKQCIDGHYEMCSNYDYLGSRCNGGFAEFVAVPLWNIIKLPDGISMEIAAMLEPAAVAYHAFVKSGFKRGQTVMITGPGAIGLILAKLFVLNGASKVLLLGRTSGKLDRAKGISNVITCNTRIQDVSTVIHDSVYEGCIDIAIEGTGASQPLDSIINNIKPNGTIVLMGNPEDNVILNVKTYSKILRKQLKILGTWNSGFGYEKDDWQTILSLLKSKELDLSDLITHTFDLSELIDALKTMADPHKNACRIIVKP